MAKAESILDLIDVRFQDATNHVSFVSDDIMGLVMPYYWGESDKVSVHNKTTFYEMYPESLPIGVKTLTDADRDIYSGYAQVKAYFAHGGGQVEVYRPSKGFKFQRMTIKNNEVSDIAAAEDGKQHDESAQVSIALKYAGFVPQSLASGFDNIAIKVEPYDYEGYDGTDTIKITVQGCKFYNGMVDNTKYAAVENPVVADIANYYELINGEYKKTTDTAIDVSKTYYTKGVLVNDTYSYTLVENPSANANPKKKGWYELNGNDYVLTTDTRTDYNKVQNPTGSPVAQGWYVKNANNEFVLSEDTEVVSGTDYYKARDYDYYMRQIASSDGQNTGKTQRVYGEYTDLEVFEGATNPLANISGESIYLENVVNSEFIDVKVFEGIDANSITEKTSECDVYDNNMYTQVTRDDVQQEVGTASEISDGIVDGYKYFRDFETSNCTLVINPYVNNTKIKYDDIDAAIATLAEYRKNVMAVIGYPVNLTDYTADAISTYFSNNAGKGYKFCIAVQGREIITLFGYRYTLNCVAGYCGKMINVAKEAHLNQIASGYIYGTYGGSLKESLLSGDVIDLMELGINSVYTSKRGNIIWGTRTMYSKQSSYFGKTNVMRVCSAILKNIYPIAIETLHTDAASNPITRASLSTMLNSVLDTFIANQDLHADSIADCSDSINTDYLTKGGTVLNIILRLHFIGLVERVSIKIIATDTSVTAEFV